MEMEDGTRIERSKGTPQGGVVSPVLANFFLHYAFDAWMAREYPDLPWCRYADDGLVHCRTEAEAAAVKAKLAARFAECHLETHPDKTEIVYCKDAKRKGKYPDTRFDFLGYCFGLKAVKNKKTREVFTNFTPQVSASSLRSMRKSIRLKILGGRPGGDSGETKPLAVQTPSVPVPLTGPRSLWNDARVATRRAWRWDHRRQAAAFALHGKRRGRLRGAGRLRPWIATTHHSNWRCRRAAQPNRRFLLGSLSSA